MAKLKPKEKAYYAHFKGAAQAAVTAADLVRGLTKTGADRAADAEQLAALSKLADSEYHAVLTALHASFVTPFDRAEIQRLSRSLTAAVARLEAVGALIHLLDPDELPDPFEQIAGLVFQAAEATAEAVGHLRKLKGIKHHHTQLRSLATEAEFHRRLLLVALTSGEVDPLAAIEMHSISVEMAAAMAALVDVAEVVETVLIAEG